MKKIVALLVGLVVLLGVMPSAHAWTVYTTRSYYHVSPYDLLDHSAAWVATTDPSYIDIEQGCTPGVNGSGFLNAAIQYHDPSWSSGTWRQWTSMTSYCDGSYSSDVVHRSWHPHIGWHYRVAGTGSNTWAEWFVDTYETRREAVSLTWTVRTS